ncbi:MAG: MBL fold metallo-hydrolase [Planctomycetia bacterium]|nr:MBL fold metallo-hydrolase [Planctomycetia bacterium]
MLKRKYLLSDPRVIELNYQARRKLGVNVYLVDGKSAFSLIDVGYLDTIVEIIDLLRELDFKLSDCKYLIATHADADHVQGLAKASELLPGAKVVAHPLAAPLIENGDVIETFAKISAQQIDLEMPPCKVDLQVNEGDTLDIGDVTLHVWHTPGHTEGQLSFKCGNVLFSGDNIYRDGGVGVIDAHHGSHLPHFISSLERIRDDDARVLLPSHGPPFVRDNAMIQKTIDRLVGYQTLPDFGTCAVHWPLLEQWERDVASGKIPKL